MQQVYGAFMEKTSQTVENKRWRSTIKAIMEGQRRRIGKISCNFNVSTRGDASGFCF